MTPCNYSKCQWRQSVTYLKTLIIREQHFILSTQMAWYQAVMTLCLINYASSHEDVLRNGGTSSDIPNLRSRLSWVASAHTLVDFPRGNNLRHPSDGRLVGTQRRSWREISLASAMNWTPTPLSSSPYRLTQYVAICLNNFLSSHWKFTEYYNHQISFRIT
jgi:hypothetical protein